MYLRPVFKYSAHMLHYNKSEKSTCILQLALGVCNEVAESDCQMRTNSNKLMHEIKVKLKSLVFCLSLIFLSFSLPQEDPFIVKPSVFNSQPQEHPTDPFHSEDPFKTDPFKGYYSCLFSLSAFII